MHRVEFIKQAHSRRVTDVTVFESIQEQMDEAKKFGKQFEDGHSGYDWEPGVNRWDRERFVGRPFENYDAARAAANSEWSEGLGIIERMVGRITSKVGKPKSVRRRPRFDEFAGDELDLDRLRSGQPFWRDCHRDVAVQVRTVTVFADITTPCIHNWQDVMWRGAAALALAYKLEEAGYRVEIWSVNGSQVDYNGLPRDGFIVTNLKRTTDPMDLSSLINGVSSWFYRTMTFCTKGALAQGRKIDDGYGYCISAPSEVLDVVSSDPKRIYIRGIWSEVDATELVEEHLRDFI